MPDVSFRPRVGRFGIMPVVTSAPMGTFTANTTTTVRIPTPPGKFYVLRAVAHASTLPADADGTIVAKIVKRRASDDTDVVLTSNLDLEAMTASERSSFAFLSTLTPPDRIFTGADTLEVDVVNNSAAIDTQAAGAHFVFELVYLE